jgi:SAM-dependent methyltransferase
MSIDRSRRITFEEVADIYNEVRPVYPESLVNDSLSLAEFPLNGCILEIGCGPGNATLAFARRGCQIVAIELGNRLAALARENCHSYPKVEITNNEFESWTPTENAFDLAIAADSFRWIVPEIGYPLVARALKSSGSAAFFWHAPVVSKTAALQEIANVYAARGLQSDNPDTSFTVTWMINIVSQTFLASGCFGKLTVRKYEYLETLTSEQYIKNLRTYSGHREMKADIRESLYAEIQATIERLGGKVDQPRQVVLFHARVKK